MICASTPDMAVRVQPCFVSALNQKFLNKKNNILPSSTSVTSVYIFHVFPAGLSVRATQMAIYRPLANVQMVK